MAKLATAPSGNSVSQANQDAVTVTSGGHVTVINTVDGTITVDGNNNPVTVGADGIYSFQTSSAAPAHEYVGIVLNMDESLLNVAMNGIPLSQTDIDEASSLGYTNGKTYILWARLDEAPITKTFTTIDGSKNSKAITITK